MGLTTLTPAEKEELSREFNKDFYWDDGYWVERATVVHHVAVPPTTTRRTGHRQRREGVRSSAASGDGNDDPDPEPEHPLPHSIFQQSFDALQKLANDGEITIKNKQELPYPAATLLAWTRFPPKSPRAKLAYDQMVASLANRLTCLAATRLKKRAWYGAWCTENPDMLHPHVIGITPLLLQYSTTDGELGKADQLKYCSNPSSITEHGLATKCWNGGIEGQHLGDLYQTWTHAGDMLLRVIAQKTAGYAGELPEIPDAVTRARRAADLSDSLEDADLHPAKRAAIEAEYAELRGYLLPEHDSEGEDGETISAIREKNGQSNVNGRWDWSARDVGTNPMELLIAAEDSPAIEDDVEDESDDEDEQRQPEYTVGELAQAMVYAVVEGTTDARSMAKALDPAIQTPIRDALLVIGTQPAQEILLAMLDLYDSGAKWFGQRSAQFMQKIREYLHNIQQMPPQPLEAVQGDTPEAKQLYQMARDVPDEPDEAPPVLDEDDVQQQAIGIAEDVVASEITPAEEVVIPAEALADVADATVGVVTKVAEDAVEEVVPDTVVVVTSTSKLTISLLDAITGCSGASRGSPAQLLLFPDTSPDTSPRGSQYQSRRKCRNHKSAGRHGPVGPPSTDELPGMPGVAYG